MVVLRRERSLKTTLPQFYDRLPQLLQRSGFNLDFIEQETMLVQEGYIVGRSNSRSMQVFMNQMTTHVESRYFNWYSSELIDLGREEDILMEWLSFNAASGRYRFTKVYWKEKGMLL
jgi:hypothetical protein